MERISITHLDNRHNDWLRALQFYKQEITFLKNRLTEIAGRNTGQEVSSQVEHFENQFKIHLDQIDTIGHNIRENMHAISNEAKNSSAGYIDTNLALKHAQLEKEFTREEDIIQDIRREFNRFSAQWL